MFKKDWRKKYFLSKIKGVDHMILDLEFKRFKTQEVREEIRDTYDAKKAQILAIEERQKLEGAKTKDDKTKMSEGDFNRLADDITRLEIDRDRYLAQIKDIDLQLNGAKPSPENPDGAQGMEDQLEALRELKDMLRDYMKLL
jgi:hypothetical protein